MCSSDLCELWGGTLAVITSPDEFIAIQNHVIKDTWIGAMDALGPGQPEWITGEPWDFEIWAPSDEAAAHSDDTCVLFHGDELAFAHGGCAEVQRYVCEKLLPEPK